MYDVIENHDLVRCLCKSGYNLERWDLRYHTALILAVKKKDIATIKILLQYGADINGVD